MLSFVDIDREHDVAYILLRPELRDRRGAVARSVRVADDIVLDLDESDHLIGIELLKASARLDVDQITTTSEIIVGVKEAAEMLGVEKSNFVRDHASKPEFPTPIAELASGRFWLRSAIERYVQKKKSRTGTPADPSTVADRRVCCAGPHPFDSRRVRESWWPEALLCLLVGESPGPPGAGYFYDPIPGDTPDPIVVRRHLLSGLAATGLIESPTLEAFRAAGFGFDHAIRCQLPTATIKHEHKLARRYASPRAHAATHLTGSVAAARKVWILGHIARDAVTHVCALRDRRPRITPPYVLETDPKVFVSQYFRRFDSPTEVVKIIEKFKTFFVTS